MTGKVEKIKENLDNALHDQSKPWTAAFEFAETKSNIPRLYIFLVAAGICVLYLAFGYAAQLLCNLIGVVYPAYISIKAIESTDKLDDTKWLTYWVIYAVFSTLEFFSGFLTSLIPFYWLLKCIFLIWCMIPVQQNGSLTMYHKIIRPYFLKHSKSADEVIDKIAGKAKKLAGDILTKTE